MHDLLDMVAICGSKCITFDDRDSGNLSLSAAILGNVRHTLYEFDADKSHTYVPYLIRGRQASPGVLRFELAHCLPRVNIFQI